MNGLASDNRGAIAAPLFEAQNLSVHFGGSSGQGDLVALEGVNWVINEGEFVSFVGPSGCGKTTMLKLVSGLVAPSSGALLHNGKALTGTPPGIGMAFQDSLLLPWRTVLDNVLLPIEILRLKRSDYLERAHALLTTVGLAGFESKKIWELSGGMRQRVSLCRAVVAKPKVLLLDEPFAALDAFTREDLWLVLQQLHDDTGCTMILITHQLNEAVFLSDRVMVVSKRPGKIVHSANITFARPRAQELALTAPFLAEVADLRRRIDR